MPKFQTLKGNYRVANPMKYSGNIENVYFRSSWELKLMKYLDYAKDCLEWSSEEVVIPYKSPIDGKYHRYFVDFKAKIKNKDGDVVTYLIEVKPAAQTQLSSPTNKKTKRYINEAMAYAVNDAKWKAAREYCNQNDMKFMIFTENELF